MGRGQRNEGKEGGTDRGQRNEGREGRDRETKEMREDGGRTEGHRNQGEQGREKRRKGGGCGRGGGQTKIARRK